ncbi:MAG: pyridoxamine 5'-phosphate oxidase family protein [Chloroherpetonaceae bacterium]|nr:pyridoxamine 5'-phosphate oxidase family protein [Chloroherpetonaceae bacterium]
MVEATADLSLETILSEVWWLLEQGVRDRRSPLHTGIFATIRDGFPEMRTVVLRSVNATARKLFCHTDIRSAKVEDLRHHANCAWLFYHPERKIQLRFLGTATVHHQTPLAEARWKDTQLMSRQCYATTLPPGTLVEAPTSGLPEYLTHRSPTLEESEIGAAHFAVIETTVHFLDWLLLDAKGHRRAKFFWHGETLSASWAIP